MVENNSTLTFEKLFELIKEYITIDEHLNKIKDAYLLAMKHHDGQVRKSGEPYIIHPLEVAKILCEMRSGPDGLIAGLLHDIVEDTDVTLEKLEEMFSTDVADIVDAVTKISKLKIANAELQKASTHQKILLAMAKDIRVILVKIADRLHNMRTLQFMKPEKQIAIARETIEIYAPLAHKMGMFEIKAELEELSFYYGYREEYDQISEELEIEDQHRAGLLDDLETDITNLLEDHDIFDYKIKSRTKNKYSIYKKMRKNGVNIQEIYDINALRIIVDTVEECYLVLGLIHSNYKPIPKRFKDYIAVPKPNLYQSLHTTIIGQRGFFYEIQIRTYKMDEVAEKGVAAHWAYKENKVYSKDKEQYEMAQTLKWYGELLELTDRNTSNPTTFINEIKGEFLEGSIYVFTPSGETISLPVGSTPLDFAYRIHTDIGHKAISAIVNGRIVPLGSELTNGDSVSINTSRTARPTDDWLNYVKTSSAKLKIRHYLNNENREYLLEQGKNLLDRALARARITDKLTDKFIEENFTKLGVKTLSELEYEIGKGRIKTDSVVEKLKGKEQYKHSLLEKIQNDEHEHKPQKGKQGLIVEGLSNVKIEFSKCCFPVPGDDIIGYITKADGIHIHSADCKNVKYLKEEKFIQVSWCDKQNEKYETKVNINYIKEDDAVLLNLITMARMSDLSLVSVKSSFKDEQITVVQLTISTANKENLDKFINQCLKNPSIVKCDRV